MAKQEVINPSEKRGKKKKKMTKKKKLLIALLIVALIVLIVCGAAVAIIFHYIGKVTVEDPKKEFPLVSSIVDDDLTSEPDSPKEKIDEITKKIEDNLKDKATEIISDDNVVNVLLIGTDSRGNDDRGRSDSMILVSINKKNKKIIMTSFLRDIYLNIPNIEDTRLNHAYAYGGPDLLINTLETNFKVRIDRYVRVNFYSFCDVVDSVGGVEIDVTDEEVPYINSYLREINALNGLEPDDGALTHSGKQVLNGRQALSYSRIRYIGTDFARTQRQRTVLMNILTKMKTLSIGELNDLLNVLLPEVATNMTEGEMFSFVVDAPAYLGYEVVSDKIPADGTWEFLTIRSMFVIGINFDENIKHLRDTIYG